MQNESNFIHFVRGMSIMSMAPVVRWGVKLGYLWQIVIQNFVQIQPLFFFF